jgi:phosphatidylglycerophosphate synthase
MSYEQIDSPPGAKKADYWWTVLAVDPVALPIVRAWARHSRPSPDQVTMISFALGLPVGLAFATGERWGLVVGAVLFYVSFVFDCVDGKLARLRGVAGARGQALDQLVDGARRASAILGLTWYLWHRDDVPGDRLWWAIAFGIISFYFMEISGAERAETSTGVGGRWSAALAKRRLLPTPGMPDVSAIVYVIGPLTGLVVPGLIVGLAMVAIGVLITYRRRLR